MKFFSERLPASIMKLVIPSIGGLVFVIFSSLILFEASMAKVAITQNGERQTVKTHSNTVGELLDEMGIVVGEHDLLSYDTDTILENGMEIKYKQAKQLFVTIDGVEHEYYSTDNTLGRFFSTENLNFSDHDAISHDANVKIEDGLHVSIQTAFRVKIDDAGKEIEVWTTGGSVGQLLKENKIRLNDEDKIKPSIDKTVDKDTLVTVVRVEKTTETIEESIPFKTEKQEDRSLAKGKEKVISEGQEGTVLKKYEITMENGKEVSRELVHEDIKEASKNQVVAVGTKEQKQNLVTLASKKETKSPSNESGEVLYMYATAFTANCGGCSGVTATGINLKSNPNKKVIAVDPNVIPLGTKVWVEGYGTAIAGDTGGSIKGNRIDAHVPTKEAAYKFGQKTVKVKILD